ncbi:MAG: M1 family metallopeptidase [Planctomycetota bacterium]
MSHRLPLTLLLLCSAAPAQGFDKGRSGLPERSERVCSYEMKVRLDPKAKTLVGEQKIRYRNRTPGRTGELRFHLYLNAFRDFRSTHMREAGPEFRKGYKGPEEFGEVRFDALRLVGGAGGPADLLPTLRFDAPDDGNADDRTVAVVALPEPLGPGQEVELATRFTARLPKAYRRTGWGPGNFFMLAQWFPKLGVLEAGDAGGSTWNCHQFHAWTEFYSDFGTYEVRIEVPAGWPVGATGSEVERGVVDDRYEFIRFRQEDVHDFAWVTDPDYRVKTEEAYLPALDPAVAALLRDRLGYDERELALTPVRITYLLHPEHDRPYVFERHRRAVHVALDFFGSRYGRYPYPTLTVVDPCTDPEGGSLGGGMEYPTLITCGTPRYPHPRRLAPEGVTVHEFGHQFWYGLSANNEFEAAWLDEGFNSYSEGRAQDLAYRAYDRALGVGDPVWVSREGTWLIRGRAPASLGPAALLPKGIVGTGLAQLPGRLRRPVRDLGFDGALLPPIDELAIWSELPVLSYERTVPFAYLYADRQQFLSAPMEDPVDRFAWTYSSRTSYRVNSYQRPATVLATLERYVGRDTWVPLMRRYHERARFAHPTGEDFLDTLAEFAGPEARRIGRELLQTTKRVDYGVEVEVRPPFAVRGLDVGADAGNVDEEVVVTVRRKGQLFVPVIVRFSYWKDGTRHDEDRLWDARDQGPWRRWVVTEAEQREKGRLLQVLVDPPRPDLEPFVGPAGVWLVDENLLDNAWQRWPNQRQAKKRSARALLWSQCLSSFFGWMG